MLSIGFRNLEDFTNRLAKVPLRFHPGDAYAYGFSTDVLGRVIEVVTGETHGKSAVSCMLGLGAVEDDNGVLQKAGNAHGTRP